MTMVDLARRFDLTPAAVSCAVQRGEKMAGERITNWKPEIFEYYRSYLISSIIFIILVSRQERINVFIGF
jgi:hypothetical protein